MKKRSYKGWLKLLIIVYCLVGTGFYYLQDKIFFRPVALPADSTYHFDGNFFERTLNLDAQTKISIGQFIPLDDTVAKGVVLYFHGNRENINHYAKFAPYFTKHHYEIWIPDYPGFGKSIGPLTEQGLYDEALQVYKLARAKYAPSQIVIYGKSLGTGVAAQLASVRDCKQLILETPYYSLVSLTRRILWMYPLDLLMHFKIPEHIYISKVTAPITIFHGSSDGVIPYGHAEKLRPFLKTHDEFITIPGGSHNDLYSFPIVTQKIDSLLSL